MAGRTPEHPCWAASLAAQHGTNRTARHGGTNRTARHGGNHARRSPLVGRHGFGRRRIPSGTADRGVSPIELAILLPLVLVLLLASIQVAAVFLARAVALNAAQIGVNACRMLDGVSEEQGRSQAAQFVADAGDWLTAGTITVEKGDTEVTAVVSGYALSLVPGLKFPVRQTAHGTRERFTED